MDLASDAFSSAFTRPSADSRFSLLLVAVEALFRTRGDITALLADWSDDHRATEDSSVGQQGPRAARTPCLMR